MNRIESPEINSHVCDQLICKKGAKNIWLVVGNMDSHMQKTETEPHTKFNSN